MLPRTSRAWRTSKQLRAEVLSSSFLSLHRRHSTRSSTTHDTRHHHAYTQYTVVRWTALIAGRVSWSQSTSQVCAALEWTGSKLDRKTRRHAQRGQSAAQAVVCTLYHTGSHSPAFRCSPSMAEANTLRCQWLECTEMFGDAEQLFSRGCSHGSLLYLRHSH